MAAVTTSSVALAGSGITMVEDKSYPGGVKDLSPVLRSIKDKNPDAFVGFTYPPDTILASKQAKEVGFKNVAIIAENSDWGFGVIDVFRKNLESTGVKVTSFNAERTVSDFTPQLLELKRADPRPDLLIAGFTGSNLLLMLRQAYDLGLAPTAETRTVRPVSPSRRGTSRRRV